MSLIGQRIAIHAAQRRSRDVLEAISTFHPGNTGVRAEDLAGRWGRVISVYGQPHWKEIAHYPLGAVVATAVLRISGKVESTGISGCVQTARVSWRNPVNPQRFDQSAILIDAFGDYRPGRWVWELTDVRPLRPPEPAKGRQGFWEWEPRT